MSVPAIPDDLNVGLEDYDPQTDVVTPRITIDHKNAVLVNSLTSEWHKDLEVVILGVVKQRTLWPAVMGDGTDPPLCKSYNFNEGVPSDHFPWRESGFNPAEYPAEKPLPCGSCPLREWGSHPTLNSPWCSETHTYVLEVPVAEGPVYAPALFSVARTGIKPSRTYLSAFAQSKTPMFISTTKLSLQTNKRGSNEYCVPVFQRGAPTDQENWRPWAEVYRRIRAFVQSPPSFDDGEPTTTSAPEPAMAATGDAGARRGGVPSDEEIPF